MNYSAIFDYSEDAEATAIGVAEACLSPIAFRPPTPGEGGWVTGGSLLDDAFCMSPVSEIDETEETRTQLRDAEAKLETLRTSENQLRIMNAAISDAFYKQKDRADEAEADLERLSDHTKKVESDLDRLRDRAMDIILSRTAEVDRLKKELAVFTGKPKTLKEAVLARLKEKGVTPYMA